MASRKRRSRMPFRSRPAFGSVVALEGRLRPAVTQVTTYGGNATAIERSLEDRVYQRAASNLVPADASAANSWASTMIRQLADARNSRFRLGVRREPLALRMYCTCHFYRRTLQYGTVITGRVERYCCGLWMERSATWREGTSPRFHGRRLSSEPRRTCGPTSIRPCHYPLLCRLVGLSERGLREAFYSVRGMSPKRWNVGVRLQCVRRALTDERAEATTVTDAAADYGFYELGRFAAIYREAFGEAPSDTLRSTNHQTAASSRTRTRQCLRQHVS